jgi:spore coat protein CotH
MFRKVVVSCCAVVSMALAAAAQDPASIFDDLCFHDVYLEMNPSDWQTLRDNYLLDTKYEASFVFNGLRYRVNVRSRGSTSRNPTKPGLRVDFDAFDKTQSFGGLRRLVLDNLSQDSGLIKERLSMKLFREMGITTPRGAQGKLFVNGVFWGVYGIIEPIEQQFLDRNVRDSSGYLYEYNAIEPYYFTDLGDDPARYVPDRFEPKTHENDLDPGTLIRFIRSVNQVPQGQLASLSNVFDVEKLVRYVAVEQYLAEVDGINGWNGMNNVYIYHSGNPAYFELFPWDKDLTFFHPERSVVSNFEQNVLTRRIWESRELRRQYLRTVRDIANRYGGPDGWLERELDFAYTQVQAAALDDPLGRCASADGEAIACGPGEGPFEEEVRKMRDFIQTRNVHVYEELALLESLP